MNVIRSEASLVKDDNKSQRASLSANDKKVENFALHEA
jgi:hypothetical protein